MLELLQRKWALPEGRLLQLDTGRMRPRSWAYLPLRAISFVSWPHPASLNPNSCLKNGCPWWQEGLVQSKIDVLVQIQHAPGKMNQSISKELKLHHLVFVPKRSGIIISSRSQQSAPLLGWSSDKNSYIFTDSHFFLRRRLTLPLNPFF